MPYSWCSPPSTGRLRTTLTGVGRDRRQPAGTSRRLHPQSTVGPAVVVANILAQDTLGVAVVENENVVEAISTEGSDHPFAKGVRLWGSRRRDQGSRAEALHPAAEPRPIDGVTVADEEARRLVIAVAHGLDEGLGGILGARRRGHSQTDYLAAPEVEDDEGVENLEPQRDDGEPVSGPGLGEMIADEGRPLLATAPRQIRGSVLGHGPRGDVVAELGKFSGDDVLAPQRILLPHPADEGSGVGIDGWSANRTTRAAAPEELPEGTVPSENRLRADDGDSREKRGKHLGHGRNGQPITGLEPGVRSGSPEDDDLLAQ